jgi:hypothetical protein
MLLDELSKWAETHSLDKTLTVNLETSRCWLLRLKNAITLLARVHKHTHTHIRTHNLSLTHTRTGACAHIQARAHTNRCVRTHTQWRTHAHTHVRFWTVNTQSYFWCCGCLLVECVWLMGESKSAHFICTLIEMNSTHDSKADFLDQKVSRTQTHFI